MRPGEIVAGRFVVDELAGAGGMGAVYRASDRATGNRVALKVVTARSPDLAARFDREARALASLRHPAIVRYVAHGESEAGAPYLAMEWLEGEDLGARLARGRLGIAESVALARRVSSALAELHARGAVHRDVKPSNLLLVEGRVEEVKLLDFGIVRLAETLATTRTGAALGTPGFMAPEQVSGGATVDARADVFAVGCVLYECLTGSPAFGVGDVLGILARLVFDDPPPLRSLRPEIPAPLEELVGRMLSKDPGARPSGGAALAAELDRHAGEEVGAAALAPPAPAITHAEQRLVSVVVASPSGPRADADTLTPEQVVHVDESLRRGASSFSARVEGLLDGTIVAIVTGKHQRSPIDQASNAARCALMIRAHLPDTPTALCTGRAVITDRFPVGGMVERASAILRAGQADKGVLLDDLSAALLDTRFDVGVWGGIPVLRGHDESTRKEAPRSLLGKPAPFVGRNRELSILLGVARECATESVARAVVVTGPAGVGKSRLRQELLRALRAEPHDFEILNGQGDPIGSGSPFRVLGEVVRRAMGLRDGEPISLRRERIREQVAGEARRDPERQRVAEFLGELVGTPFPADGREQLAAARGDPRLMGDQLLRAWEDFVAARCAQRPVVLLLDDLQWGDLPSVQFVDAALRNLADRPLMAVGFGRPDLRERFPRLWMERNPHILGLGELSRRASEELITTVLGAGVGAETVKRLAEQAGGNAFFLEELIRRVAGGDSGALPETIVAMVDARLDALEPDGRRILRAASVYGRQFWRGGVLALLGRDPGTTSVERADEWLSHLIDREILSTGAASRFAGEEQYAFRHPLVRESAYASLTEEDRVLGHRLAAAWLEAVGEVEPGVLADHHERGGELAEAASAYRLSAERALGGDDLAGTIALAQRGIRCLSTAERPSDTRAALLVLTAEAHRWRGDFESGLTCAEEGLFWAVPESRTYYAALAGVAFASAKLTRNDRVLELAKRVRELPRSGQVGEAQSFSALRVATPLAFLGRIEEAAELLAWAEAAHDGEDPIFASRAVMARSAMGLFQDPGREIALMEDCVRALERAGDIRNGCTARAHLAVDYLKVGAFEIAEEVLAFALGAAERLGLEYVAAMVRQNLGLSLMLHGELRDAERTQREALAVHVRLGDPRAIGFSRAYLASTHALLGDLEEAEREATRAVETLASLPPAQAPALARLAQVLLGRAPERALEAASRAHDLLVGLPVLEEGEALVRLVYAEALHGAGRTAAAEDALRVARDRVASRAAGIADPALRESFLTRIPENARTLELARAWRL